MRAIATDAGGRREERGWLSEASTRPAPMPGRRYGQAGLLHWNAREPVRLRMYRARPGPVHPPCGAGPVDRVAPASS